MAFPDNMPTINVGWATIYLNGDEIIVCTDIQTPAEVVTYHNRNPNHKFAVDEATHIRITKNKPRLTNE
jgi:hypothetical protein